MIASPTHSIDQAFFYIVGISLVLLTLITAAMAWFVFRYDHRKNPVPSDIRDNALLETVWLVVPTLIALSMFVFGWRAYLDVRRVPPGAIDIQTEGRMFSWTFRYPNGKETIDDLVIPQGKPVRLSITSKDVIHGVFIPAFRLKVDAVPGLTTRGWLLSKETGIFDLLCAEFCGTGHADMRAILRVVTPEEYEEWLNQAPENFDEDIE